MVQEHSSAPFSQSNQYAGVPRCRQGPGPWSSGCHVHLMPAGSFCEWYFPQKGGLCLVQQQPAGNGTNWCRWHNLFICSLQCTPNQGRVLMLPLWKSSSDWKCECRILAICKMLQQLWYLGLWNHIFIWRFDLQSPPAVFDIQGDVSQTSSVLWIKG